MLKKEEAWWGWAHWVTPVSSVHYVCWKYFLQVAGSGWSPGGVLKLVQKVWEGKEINISNSLLSQQLPFTTEVVSRSKFEEKTSTTN